jgi:2-polyprenyl-3-methyl-5-hydroxy-6-metoxy-1,4-benzoquinol methylase
MRCLICEANLPSQGRGPWEILSCKACGHRLGEFARRSQAKLEKEPYFDSSKYIHFRSNNPAYFEQLAVERVTEIEQLGLLEPGASIFEVGCSTGEILNVLKHRKYRAFGYDPSQQAVEYARKHRQLEAYWKMDDLPTHPVDAVFAFHVIEHVADPAAFLNTTTARLIPNGLLYLRMPYAGSTVAAIFGMNWPGYSVEHIHFFSRSSIEKLLAQSGFRLLHFGTQSHARFLAGALRRLANGGSRPMGEAGKGGNSMPSGRAFQIMRLLQIVYAPMAAVERWILRGDELVIVAQKIDQAT